MPKHPKLTDEEEGDYKDGRRIHVFKDIEDVKAKEKVLQHVIREWLKLIEK